RPARLLQRDLWTRHRAALRREVRQTVAPDGLPGLRAAVERFTGQTKQVELIRLEIVAVLLGNVDPEPTALSRQVGGERTIGHGWPLSLGRAYGPGAGSRR